MKMYRKFSKHFHSLTHFVGFTHTKQQKNLYISIFRRVFHICEFSLKRVQTLTWHFTKEFIGFWDYSSLRVSKVENAKSFFILLKLKLLFFWKIVWLNLCGVKFDCHPNHSGLKLCDFITFCQALSLLLSDVSKKTGGVKKTLHILTQPWEWGWREANRTKVFFILKN